MKTDYATIQVNVKVDEEEIKDLRRELAISDMLAEIANELEKWLETKGKNTPFIFEVELE